MASILVVLAASVAVVTSGASAAAIVPQPGNWEGFGPHGLPLSFSLWQWHGRLLPASVAVGAPLTCPAGRRDAEAVPLSFVAYSGPGAGAGRTGASAVLSGKVPGLGRVARLTGRFTSPTTGTFTLQVRSSVGCGWPTRILTWSVLRASRRRIADGVWTAGLRGPGITGGGVRVSVTGRGRVVRSFRASYRCESATVQGRGAFAASPAYEFIRPRGSFYSPLHGNPLRGHRTLRAGRFERRHQLAGVLHIFDTCTERVVALRFQR